MYIQQCSPPLTIWNVRRRQVKSNKRIIEWEAAAEWNLYSKTVFMCAIIISNENILFVYLSVASCCYFESSSPPLRCVFFVLALLLLFWRYAYCIILTMWLKIRRTIKESLKKGKNKVKGSMGRNKRLNDAFYFVNWKVIRFNEFLFNFIVF